MSSSSSSSSSSSVVVVNTKVWYITAFIAIVFNSVV